MARGEGDTDTLIGPTVRAAALILAGGQSQRMGRDKALLTLPDGRTALEAVAATAAAVCGEVWLSIDTRAHADLLLPRLAFEPRVLLDSVPGEGPLAALAGALHSIKAQVVILVPVDMPFLSAEALSMLRDSWLALEDDGSVDIVAPVVDGRIQPLPACYATGLYERVVGLVEHGSRALYALLDLPGIRVLPLDVQALGNSNPHAVFAGANTMDEWTRLCAEQTSPCPAEGGADRAAP